MIYQDGDTTYHIHARGRRQVKLALEAAGVDTAFIDDIDDVGTTNLGEGKLRGLRCNWIPKGVLEEIEMSLQSSILERPVGWGIQ